MIYLHIDGGGDDDDNDEKKMLEKNCVCVFL